MTSGISAISTCTSSASTDLMESKHTCSATRRPVPRSSRTGERKCDGRVVAAVVRAQNVERVVERLAARLLPTVRRVGVLLLGDVGEARGDDLGDVCNEAHGRDAVAEDEVRVELRDELDERRQVREEGRVREDDDHLDARR
eukprot:5990205-Prymnesium_polylepis.1